MTATSSSRSNRNTTLMCTDHDCHHAAILLQGSVVYYVQTIANCIGMGGSIRQLLAAKNLQVSILCQSTVST